jgi:hypothetical protein
MKKTILFFATMLLLVSGYAVAQLSITKVDKVNPNDEIFMDMALTAAKTSLSEGGLPCGAVVILNGALRSAGQPTEVATAEETAIATSRRKTLKNAVIYTINEPTTEVYNLICSKKAEAVYFVNARDKVIAKGIYPAEAYDDSKIDTTLTQVPMMQLDFKEAASFLNSYNK